MSMTVTYKSSVADDRHVTELIVRPDGVGQLWVGSNRDRRTDPIGRFQGRVAAALMQRLTAHAAALPAAGAGAPLEPDEAYREITVAAPGAAPRNAILGGPSAPAAAAADLERTLLEIAQQLRDAPQAALGLRLQVPASAPAGARLAFDVLLTNAGPSTLRLPPPPQWQAMGLVFELMLLRADLPMASLGPADQHFVLLGPDQLFIAEPAGTASEWVLPPGRSMRLGFAVPVAWKPARYAVELSLEVPVKDDAQARPWRGGLVSEAQKLDVVAR